MPNLDFRKQKAKEIAELILTEGKTIREVADELKLTKSTTHRYIHNDLPLVDKKSYDKILKFLSYHKRAVATAARRRARKFKKLKEDNKISFI